MEEEQQYSVTYAEGPELVFTNALTRCQFAALCRSLAHSFGEKLGGGYEFEPERVTEGGLEMTLFPGKAGAQYKSLRLHMRARGGHAVQWPWIEPGLSVLTEWEALSDQQPLIPTGTKASTTLKAFYGAPVWTLLELGLVRQVLAAYGVRCKRMPAAKTLSSPRSGCT